MKTQLMDVKILNTNVQAYTNGMIVFKSLETAGNLARAAKGKSMQNMSQFLVSDDMNNYLESLLNKANKDGLNIGSPAGDKWEMSDLIRKEGKTKTSRLIVHVNVALKIAMKMDSDLEVSIVEAFISGKILEYRLMGGDEFKHFNAALLEYLPSERGHDDARRINAAKLIRAKCELKRPEDEEIETWNQEAADSIAQSKRVEILSTLTKMLRLGVIRDWDHLKEIIEKL